MQVQSRTVYRVCTATLFMSTTNPLSMFHSASPSHKHDINGYRLASYPAGPAFFSLAGSKKKAGTAGYEARYRSIEGRWKYEI